MSQPRPTLPRSSGSRSSFASVGRLPVISEDLPVRPSTPTTPPRIPPKSLRRSRIRSPQSAARPLPLGSPPLPPPPYAPPAYTPRLYPSKKDVSLFKDKDKPWGNDIAAAYSEPWASTAAWLSVGRRKWKLAASLVALVVVIIALAVGLAFGLQERNSNGSSSNGTSRSNALSDSGTTTPYPQGSYAFPTALRTSLTNCTSNPSTWRCYPYDVGASARFFWTIGQVNSFTFNVSSSANPFAPSFSDLTMRLVDGNQPTERLVFSYAMEKTVAPSGDVVGEGNRAAMCTFADTTFEGTVWTRRRAWAEVPVEEQVGSTSFGEWPGDVQIVQRRRGADASQQLPVCEDLNGDVVGSVQAAEGDCECRYDNFSD